MKAGSKMRAVAAWRLSDQRSVKVVYCHVLRPKAMMVVMQCLCDLNSHGPRRC